MQKVILISGANRGIGLAIAQHLSQLGYTLSLGVREPANAIKGLPLSENIQTFHFDATDASTANSWVQKSVETFGKIDALIHCAGILKPFGLHDDEAILDEMFDVNVKGSLRISRECMPYLKQSGQGRIINLVSMSGKRIKGQNIGYGISKFGQYALSQGLKNIGWEDGVRVTSICPSWVRSDMASRHSSMQIDDMTQPEDIASIVALLLNLSNEAAIAELLINCNLET